MRFLVIRKFTYGLKFRKRLCLFVTACLATLLTWLMRYNIVNRANEVHYITDGSNELHHMINRANDLLHSTSLLRNISTRGLRNKGTLFAEVPDEKYLSTSMSFFRPRVDIENSFEYKFIISGENICNGERHFMLIVMPSVANHVEMRQAIRRTWLDATFSQKWPEYRPQRSIKYLFLFGTRSLSYAKDLELLRNESALYGDIVMADFGDTYRNLTRKILTGLRWMNMFCPQAELFMKVDEDTFINIPLLMELLPRVLSNASTETFVLGYRHSHPRPKVSRKGKWQVAVEDYPLEFFPKYMYGHAYIISRPAVPELMATARKMALLPPEDAFITGIVPKTAQIPRLHAPSFTQCCRRTYDCEVVYNQRVALTGLKTPELMWKLWENVENRLCSSSVTFFSSQKSSKEKVGGGLEMDKVQWKQMNNSFLKA